jgi:hypothetical protein
VIDELLRRRALEALGPWGFDLAREALEGGTLDVSEEAATWEGSAGTMHGDVVTLHLPEAVYPRVLASPSAQDALVRAVAAALSEREGRVLYDLRYLKGGIERVGEGPYRTSS